MTTPKVLAFAGSARRDSFNKKLVRIAARGVEQSGAGCTLLDLRDFPMPLYDGDLEARDGLPESAARLRALLGDHQGLLISAPEHNTSITALLKNTIDWATRTPDGKPDISGFRGKTATLLSASPGSLGGLRGLLALRSLFGNIGVTVLPDQLCIGQAHKAFGPDDELLDSSQRKRAEELGADLARVLLRLHRD